MGDVNETDTDTDNDDQDGDNDDEDGDATSSFESTDSGSVENTDSLDDSDDSLDSTDDDDDDVADINAENNDDDDRLSDRSGAILGEKANGNGNGYGSDSNASESMDYYVKITLINMWLILGLIVIVNCVFYWCYCRKQRRENRKRSAAEAYAENPHQQVFDEEQQMI